MKAQDPNEIFDVVDAADRVVGRATRAEVHARKLFHRAVHVFVFTPGGSLILQKRSLAKDTCPGLLSSSCAGHVDAGESYAAAAVRELSEELGVRVPAARLEFVGMQTPSGANGFEFVRVYALRGFTGTLRPNPAEISALEIFSRERLEAAVTADARRFASSFVAALKDFFLNGDGF